MSQPVVLHADGDIIRATRGVQELFAKPSVTLKACYAVPRASSSRSGLNGDAIEDGCGEEEKSGWIVGEELSKQQGEVGWEEKCDLRWPFRHSTPPDWEGRAYLLSHVLTLLDIRLVSNTCPLLFIPPSSPPTLPLPDQAMYTQIAFETLNVPAFSILPSPLAAIFALGATTGIILNVSDQTSEISLIVDGTIRWEAVVSVNVGMRDCEQRFEGLLFGDEGLDRELRNAAGVESWGSGQKEMLVHEVAETVWRECTGVDVEVPPATSGGKGFVVAATATEQDEGGFDVAKKLIGEPGPTNVPSHRSKKQQAQLQAAALTKAAADQAAATKAALSYYITISIPSLPEKEIQLGPIRHRLCEPLLLGKSPGEETVWEGMGRALEVATISIGERLGIWEGVGVTGEIARVKSFSPALMTYLAPLLLSSPELASDTQASKVRLLSIPDYFTNFKGSTSELAPFLGGSLAARTSFSDHLGKLSVNKVDYNARGPAAIYTVIEER